MSPAEAHKDESLHEAEAGTLVSQLRRRLEEQEKVISRCSEIEISLRESEEKYRFLVENSKDIFWKIDLQGRFQFISSNVERVTGYSVSDIVGNTIWDFLAPESHQMAKEMLKKRLEGEEIPPYEVDIIARDGHYVPFEVLTTPVIDQRGHIIAIQGVSRDISYRKHVEEELKTYREELERRVEERTVELDKAMSTLQAILDTAPIGIIVAEAETEKITYYTKTAAEMFGGRITGEASGPEKGSYELLRPDGSPFPGDRLPLVRSLRYGEQVSNVEILVRRSDGTELTALASSATVLDATGRIMAAVASVIDITNIKRAEAALREEKERAELYLDLMGHDINNMNHIAMGYLEMAMDRLKTGEKIDENNVLLLSKPLEMMKNSSALIDNVRKIQRISEGDLKIEEIDVAAMLDELAHEYSNVPGREVIIRYERPAPIFVLANRLLKDVFINIIGNAIKHSAGPLEISIKLDEVTRKGKKYCRVEIADNGPGIPDNMKSRLLTLGKRGGRGLGLYLVQTFVTKFSGMVCIKDRVPGDYTKGTRFIILLPATRL